MQRIRGPPKTVFDKSPLLGFGEPIGGRLKKADNFYPGFGSTTLCRTETTASWPRIGWDDLNFPRV